MTDTPNTAAVEEQLQRILAADAFSAGLRVKAFLDHIVTEELAGRGEQLKGTALAMDLYGRGADFDPANDPIVRTEAVKLRKALEHYYLTAGSGDPLQIIVPKGGYRPRFVAQEGTPQPSPVPMSAPRSGLPVVTIQPFVGDVSGSAALVRDGLPGELALELAKFGHIRVCTVMDAIAAPSGDYLLEGQVQQAGDTMRIVLLLKAQTTGEVIWSERYRMAGGEDVFDVQEQIAKACATQLADAYGAVTEDINAMRAGRAKEDAGVFEALLAFHAHMRTSRRESLEDFTALADLALRDNPDNGLAHALVALGKLESFVFGKLQLAEMVAQARPHAEQAVALAPTCQEALFVAAALALVQDDAARFGLLCDRAVQVNPNGALLIGMAGAWFVMAGELDRGLELVEAAVAANTALPVWLRVPLATGAIANGEFSAASDYVRGVNFRDVFAEWLVAAVAHGLAKAKDEAAIACDHLKALEGDPKLYVDQMPLGPDMKDIFHRGLAWALSAC